MVKLYCTSKYSFYNLHSNSLARSPGQVKPDSNKRNLWKNLFELIEHFSNFGFWARRWQKLMQKMHLMRKFGSAFFLSLFLNLFCSLYAYCRHKTIINWCVMEFVAHDVHVCISVFSSMCCTLYFIGCGHIINKISTFHEVTRVFRVIPSKFSEISAFNGKQILVLDNGLSWRTNLCIDSYHTTRKL